MHSKVIHLPGKKPCHPFTNGIYGSKSHPWYIASRVSYQHAPLPEASLKPPETKVSVFRKTKIQKKDTTWVFGNDLHLHPALVAGDFKGGQPSSGFKPWQLKQKRSINPCPLPELLPLKQGRIAERCSCCAGCAGAAGGGCCAGTLGSVWGGKPREKLREDGEN